MKTLGPAVLMSYWFGPWVDSAEEGVAATLEIINRLGHYSSLARMGNAYDGLSWS
jgi:hypothetical protein